MIRKLKYYKEEKEDHTTYYYYIEKEVYVSRRCYIYAAFILFGIVYICFQNCMWLCYGVNLDTFFTYLYLGLVIYWLFYVRYCFKMLKVFCNRVKLLKKVKIKYKNGIETELSNF